MSNRSWLLIEVGGDDHPEVVREALVVNEVAWAADRLTDMIARRIAAYLVHLPFIAFCKRFVFDHSPNSTKLDSYWPR